MWVCSWPGGGGGGCGGDGVERLLIDGSVIRRWRRAAA